MQWISVLILAVAVSIDSLAMGITYGLNQIAIPWSSRLALGLVSGCSVLAAMALGGLVEQWLTPSSAQALGGCIFILLGLYSLWRSYQPKQPRILVNLRIPILGLIVQVFQEPLTADLDCSQTITGGEAFLLGGALALDALAAGIGAALIKLPLWPTTLAVALATLIFISQGLRTGTTLRSLPQKGPDLRWLPGVIVFSMGLLKIIF